MDRADAVALAVVYVVPLGGAVVFLAAVGLVQLAVALVAVEAVVLGLVVWAKRTPSG